MVERHGFAGFCNKVNDPTDRHGSKVALELGRVQKYDLFSMGHGLGIESKIFPGFDAADPLRQFPGRAG
jgi:hypothetical protein